ncbi:hypothetical protein L0F63_005155 [Massospora cicadina]|nr:hypothetical protein L0F63_005155 [Massospora cicadina]
MSLNSAEQLSNLVISFLLGVLVLTPILTVLIFIFIALGWFYQLPSIKTKRRKSTDTLAWTSLQEKVDWSKDEKHGSDFKTKGLMPTSISVVSSKRGWLRVTTTPNPTQTPTIFEMMQDVVVKNWNSGANFFTNTSAFALNFGSSLSLKNKRHPSEDSSFVYGHDQNEQNSSICSFPGTPEAYSFLTPLKNDERPHEHEEPCEEANGDGILKPNDHRKCKPSQRGTRGWYYAVLGESTLSLYKDGSCQELMTVLRLPMYDIGLYPFDLKEGELYHVAHPILLAGHSVPVPDPINPSTSSSHEAHYINSDPIRLITSFAPSSVSSSQSSTCASLAKMWLPNYYLFAESPIEKEDWLQLLLPRCRFAFSNSEQLRRLRSHTFSLPSKDTITGLSSYSFKLLPVGFNPFLHEDLRTRLVGVESKRGSCFSETSHLKKSDDKGEAMTWFNAIAGRLYLGLRGSAHLQRSFRCLFQTQMSKLLPWWLQLNLELISLAPRLPRIFSIPKLCQFNSQGQLEVRIPIQHFGPLVDLQVDCCFFPPECFPKASSLWAHMLSFLHIPQFLHRHFPLSVQLGLKMEDEPFHTDIILKLLGFPTLNCWVGAEALPQGSQRYSSANTSLSLANAHSSVVSATSDSRHLLTNKLTTSNLHCYFQS